MEKISDVLKVLMVLGLLAAINYARNRAYRIKHQEARARAWVDDPAWHKGENLLKFPGPEGPFANV